MKKLIAMLAVLSILTGCTNSSMILQDQGEIGWDRTESMTMSDENNMYIDDNSKGTIKEINNLSEKYKNIIDENGSDYLYIDIHESNNLKVDFDNQRINIKEYFHALVDVLDKSLAKGLKEHIEDMESRDIKEGEIVLRKIGRAIIYTEKGYENSGNSISIKVNFSDIEDQYARSIFEKVSGENYILDGIREGQELNMIDFTNPNKRDYEFQDDYLAIRYNMFLKDQDIEKINILIQNKNKAIFKEEDKVVFKNLLNVLKLKEEEKELLLDSYEDILQSKATNKKIDLNNYKILINSNKGNIYSEKDRKLIYFSIEKI